MKEVGFQESWNKKRILIASFLIAVLIGIGLELKGNTISNFLKNKPSFSAIKGVATYKNPNQRSAPDIGSAVSQKLESIKQDAENINISEIATSTPQIQKIINDIKNLQNLPSNQLKDACLNICKGL
ncbi:MAG: hypothetical protein HYT08_01950 [Candidatus Levybacteria bacterium]|nr:hypothetical protein [Candidatus Levybacteria bacterium]